MKKYIIISLMFIRSFTYSQLSDECKLNIGTNLNGVCDYCTEIPFVNLMKSSRQWYTKSKGDPNEPWDSELISEISLRADGYPTHIPQTVASSEYPQQVSTVWAITDAWPPGEYVLLWDGVGSFSFWGAHTDWTQTDSNRIVINYPNPVDGIFEITITDSDINNPVRNMRLLMPGTESTYQTNPFYDLWIEKLESFKTVRFMDWGHTNFWGQVDEYTTGPNQFTDWDERSKPDYYTWAHFKGIPYEMMVKLMNDYDKDGWVCVPHTASEDYVRKMTAYFRDHLNTNRHIYVEYSNEIWNWSFGQTDWLYDYGCEALGVDWPEGLAPYIEKVLSYWTDEFKETPDRITRIIGTQAGWYDVSERIVNNVDPKTFDAISPTYYFGLSESGDQALDALGANATVEDVEFYARQNMPTEQQFITNIAKLAKANNKKLVFYEGGQHLTPEPFGEEPTYAKALLDIQRDNSMYEMYNEWYDTVRTYQKGDEPLLLMNYSFIGQRSAQYGSWGILETMAQDTNLIPAPKYKSTLENMNTACIEDGNIDIYETKDFIIYPNPASNTLYISGAKEKIKKIRLLDSQGKSIYNRIINYQNPTVDLTNTFQGFYLVQIFTDSGIFTKKIVVSR